MDNDNIIQFYNYYVPKRQMWDEADFSLPKYENRAYNLIYNEYFKPEKVTVGHDSGDYFNAN